MWNKFNWKLNQTTRQNILVLNVTNMGFRVEYPPVYKPGMPCTKCSDDAPFCDNGLCGKYFFFTELLSSL